MKTPNENSEYAEIRGEETERAPTPCRRRLAHGDAVRPSAATSDRIQPNLQE
jgi:hypothetical protein